MRPPLPLWQVFFLLALLAGSVAFADSPEVELRMVLQVHGEGGAKATEAQVARTAEVLKSRLDMADADDPEVTVKGDRISVRAGGIEDPDRLRHLLLSNAKLEFRFVTFPEGGGGVESREAILQNYNGNLPPGVEILEGDQLVDGRKTGTLYYAVEKKRAVGGEDFQSVRPTLGQFDNPMLSFTLTPEAASVFGEMTGANVGKGLAIVLNDRVVSAPVVRSRITDTGQMEGNFTKEEVQDLAAALNSGALTAPITVLEETRGNSPMRINKTASTALFVLIAVLGFFTAKGLFNRKRKPTRDEGAGQD